MSKTKLKTSFDKAGSTYSKKINRLKSYTSKINKSNLKRKDFIKKINIFIDLLILENKISKIELKQFLNNYQV
jgi:hypothetical protein